VLFSRLDSTLYRITIALSCREYRVAVGRSVMVLESGVLSDYSDRPVCLGTFAVGRPTTAFVLCGW